MTPPPSEKRRITATSPARASAAVALLVVAALIFAFCRQTDRRVLSQGVYTLTLQGVSTRTYEGTATYERPSVWASSGYEVILHFPGYPDGRTGRLWFHLDSALQEGVYPIGGSASGIGGYPRAYLMGQGTDEDPTRIFFTSDSGSLAVRRQDRQLLGTFRAHMHSERIPDDGSPGPAIVVSGTFRIRR